MPISGSSGACAKATIRHGPPHATGGVRVVQQDEPSGAVQRIAVLVGTHVGGERQGVGGEPGRRGDLPHHDVGAEAQRPQLFDGVREDVVGSGMSAHADRLESGDDGGSQARRDDRRDRAGGRRGSGRRGRWCSRAAHCTRGGHPGAAQARHEVFSVDTGAQTIELGRTPDTELPGRYGLFVDGTPGYVKLGAVLHADARSVRRKLLTQIEPGAQVGRRAAFSGYYYFAPGELHLPYESVLIGTPAGPCPAWLFPAESTTWVIQVHGRGATRSECLRAVPVLHAAGLPVLVDLVPQRRRGAAHPRRDRYGLGSDRMAGRRRGDRLRVAARRRARSC